MIQRKPSPRRDRYQTGSLTREKRSSGPAVWVYRWREQASRGQTVQRKRIVGTVQEYRTETAARRAVEGLQLEVSVTILMRDAQAVLAAYRRDLVEERFDVRRAVNLAVLVARGVGRDVAPALPVCPHTSSSMLDAEQDSSRSNSIFCPHSHVSSTSRHTPYSVFM